ncbi:MAG: 6-phosphofructokinase [Alphaproteobacteria bacterium]|nr:6-phosphofructokinase [Alphaproteobacteria bacterium]
MKKIGIMTTGGDCSGLNSVINRIVLGARNRGWRTFGIIDGTDGLCHMPANAIELTPESVPVEMARMAGSFLHNGNSGIMNFETAIKMGRVDQFNKNLKRSLATLHLDALILIGGNGSFSLAYKNNDIYSKLSLVCIPKTIDFDIPLTDRTIGFDTAVNELVKYCDQVLLTARSHHRWFVVQTMGRECGRLALNAGVAVGADAIIVPEIKFNVDDLVEHVRCVPRDYGIIMVSEGITLRGHSGRPADMISRALTAAGITNRAAFPDYIQRSGDTTAADRITAAKMVTCALDAIENRETNVITALQDNVCKTVSLADFYAAGDISRDPNIPDLCTSNAYIEPDDPLLDVATAMNIYIGEMK